LFRYLISILLCISIYGKDGFKLYKMNKNEINSQTTVLIVGGIHGNEPGSYFAPSLFVQHYKVTKNQVWVIPSLNTKSIQKNSRGVYGDMNRKFKYIKKSDYDYNKITRLKKIILDDRVSMILNLHDGHGYFRPRYKNNKENPHAWGQASVIDQKELSKKKKFSNLYQIAQQVTEHINKNINISVHSFRIKNTETKYRDLAQQNSLTYFAVKNQKPAFAIETSKEIQDLSMKVLYQLQAIESYLKVAHIEYKRDFELNKEEISKLLKDFGKIQINKNTSFNATNIRPYIGFFPLKRHDNEFVFSNPLGSYSYSRNLYHLYIGNKHISTLKPDYFKIKSQNKNITIEADNKTKKVKIGETIKVNNYFIVKAPRGIRVNVIGFGDRNDNFKKINKEYIPAKYSLDSSKHLFRIELYEKSVFLGMIIVNFHSKF